MRDLVEFLRARLDEDEERARFVQREQGDRAWRDPEPWRLSWHDEYDLLCIEPSRALAEVEAKRRIVRAFESNDNYELYGGCGDDCEWGALDYALKALALPYADHPDYDPTWRP